MKFEGIPHQMGEFFMQIKMNNDSVFFNEHRKEYENFVRDPLYALAEALAPTAQSIDPSAETRPARVVSRIRRDTRFTRDKSPYRDHMWLEWRHMRTPDSEQRQHMPCLYLSVEINRWSVGAGYYAATPTAMKYFRDRLLAAPTPFLSIVSEPAFAETFGLFGEEYKRAPAGLSSVPERLHPWYIKKSFYVDHTEAMDGICATPAFADRAAALLRMLGPLYSYLDELHVPDGTK